MIAAQPLDLKPSRGCGGTGRHAAFRSPCPKGRGGSNPLSRTSKPPIPKRQIGVPLLSSPAYPPLSSRGLGRRILSPETRVRIPVAVLKGLQIGTFASIPRGGIREYVPKNSPKGPTSALAMHGIAALRGAFHAHNPETQPREPSRARVRSAPLLEAPRLLPWWPCLGRGGDLNPPWKVHVFRLLLRSPGPLAGETSC
jgi:hypothetical protein